jgi:hypothetical protein
MTDSKKPEYEQAFILRRKWVTQKKALKMFPPSPRDKISLKIKTIPFDTPVHFYVKTIDS